MTIGIVIAMNKEFRRIVSLLTNATETDVHGRKFITGHIGDNDAIVVQCGIGKVNAAIGATELIDTFHPDAVVSTGVAGGASTALNIQEVVVAAETCYHDVYCGEEQSYGQIPGMPPRFKADERLLGVATSLDCGVKISSGLTVTGDWFVDSREKMQAIVDKFPEAMAVDMESAAIAHVCHLRQVAFVSFRIISDIPLKDTHASQYFDFWDKIADDSFNVTKAFLEAI